MFLSKIYYKQNNNGVTSPKLIIGFCVGHRDPGVLDTWIFKNKVWSALSELSYMCRW